MSTNAKATVFVFTDASGNLQAVQCNLNDVSYKRSRAIAKFETFCAIDKSPGNIDTAITVAGEWVGSADPDDIDAIFDGLIRDQTARLYKYGPGGSGVGLVMYSGVSYCTDYEIKAKTGGIVEVSMTLEAVGDDVRTVW